MSVSEGWSNETMRLNAFRMGLRPLYAINVKPKGVEYA